MNGSASPKGRGDVQFVPVVLGELCLYVSGFVFFLFCVSFTDTLPLTAGELLLIYFSACGRRNNPFFFKYIPLLVTEVIITVFTVL